MEILGLNPAYVIAGSAALGLLLVVFVSILAGPATILDGAFGLLSQTVTTASATLGSLIASSGTVVAQGMMIPTTVITQAGMIIGNAIAGSVAVLNTVFSVATTAIAASAQIVSSAVAMAGQIVAGGAAMVANIITSGAAGIASIYFTIQNATIQLGTVLITGAIMALGTYYSFITVSAAQIVGSLFTSLAAILGQFLSIPMIGLFAFMSVGTSTTGVTSSVSIGGISVFTSLFSKITDFFSLTGPTSFVGLITTKIPTAITSGFTSLTNGLPNILRDVFFGTV